MLNYSLGGFQDFLRNQITFAGLKENQVNSIASAQLGVQVEPFPKLLVTARANAALYDFAGLKPEDRGKANFLSGYSLSAGHRSFLGPTELSLHYNDQSRTFAGYMCIVVGFSF